MTSMTEQQYLDERLDDQIDWYNRKSQRNQRWFKRLRLFEVSAAASIPVLISFDVPLVAGAVGGLVAMVSGALALYKFDELWVGYRATCQALQQEKIFYETGIGPYATDVGRFRRLVARVEAIVSQEYASWTEVVRASAQEEAPEEEGPDPKIRPENDE